SEKVTAPSRAMRSRRRSARETTRRGLYSGDAAARGGGERDAGGAPPSLRVRVAPAWAAPDSRRLFRRRLPVRGRPARAVEGGSDRRRALRSGSSLGGSVPGGRPRARRVEA